LVFLLFSKTVVEDRLYRGRFELPDPGMVWAVGPYGPYLVRPPLYPTTPSIWTPAPFQPPFLLSPSPSGPNSIVPADTSQRRVCALCGTLGNHRCVSESKGAACLQFVCRNTLDPRRDIVAMNVARVCADKPPIGAPRGEGYSCDACRKALGVAHKRLVALPAAVRCSPMKKKPRNRPRLLLRRGEGCSDDIDKPATEFE
jgi:hypothetical protein